jgi:hypothetical protein
VSALVTFTELGASGGFASLPGLKAVQPADEWADPAAVHCGTAMGLVTPAVGPAAVGYTFVPEGGAPVLLPPVWRCACGFQLDAGLGAGHAPAFCA